MSDKSYILDEQLPLNQDFKAIKEKGLSYIQEFSGTEWTNFNPSDPGITILDQVCFALTELGYCNNFPVQDILTNKEGKLEFESQFFTPEEILTTSPITIQDYRKYLIDGVEGIVNVMIEPINSYISDVSYAYRIHLYIDPVITDSINELDSGNLEAQKKSTQIDQICAAAFYLLNESRNLGELFLMPKPFKNKSNQLFGTIEIENPGNVEKILGKIREGIEELIFPRVAQSGYQLLKEKGIETNEIFNGPILKNGWIDDSDLKDKSSTIHSEEITHLISLIEGVVAVSNISFTNDSKGYELHAKTNELLVIDLVNSIREQNLVIICKGKNVYDGITAVSKVSLAPRKLHLEDMGSAIQLQPDLPSGNYRDINSYYSIQNTFPEVFCCRIIIS